MLLLCLFMCMNAAHMGTSLNTIIIIILYLGCIFHIMYYMYSLSCYFLKSYFISCVVFSINNGILSLCLCLLYVYLLYGQGAAFLV